MEIYKKNAVYKELKDLVYNAKKDDFIEITEWINGEGFDVYISGPGNMEENFKLTWGTYQALKTLVKKLNKMKK